MVGEFSHPLYRRGGPQPGHDQMQIPGDRVLAGQQHHQVLVEVLTAATQAGHSGVHTGGVGLPGHRGGRVEDDLAGPLGEFAQHDPQTPQRRRVLPSTWSGNVHTSIVHRVPTHIQLVAETALWRLGDLASGNTKGA